MYFGILSFSCLFRAVFMENALIIFFNKFKKLQVAFFLERSSLLGQKLTEGPVFLFLDKEGLMKSV